MNINANSVIVDEADNDTFNDTSKRVKKRASTEQVKFNAESKKGIVKNIRVNADKKLLKVMCFGAVGAVGYPLIPTLVQAPPAAEQVLSDGSGAPIHTINNIIPTANSTEYEKMFFKSQEEAIAHYRRCLQDERQDFGKERILYTNKLQEQSDKILELNLAINTLKAENEHKC